MARRIFQGRHNGEFVMRISKPGFDAGAALAPDQCLFATDVQANTRPLEVLPWIIPANYQTCRVTLPGAPRPADEVVFVEVVLFEPQYDYTLQQYNWQGAQPTFMTARPSARWKYNSPLEYYRIASDQNYLYINLPLASAPQGYKDPITAAARLFNASGQTWPAKPAGFYQSAIRAMGYAFVWFMGEP